MPETPLSNDEAVAYAIAVLRAKGCVITSYEGSTTVYRVAMPGIGATETMLSEHVISLALGCLMKPTVLSN